ncbi:MAG: hypothetical protein FGM40_07660 [Rhodocyclaceae bacterium]|nr:hypothetical protein [Rhodocyclaceae bacterium]
MPRARRIAAAAVYRSALATRAMSRGEFFDVYCLPLREGTAKDEPGPQAEEAPKGEPFLASRLGLVVPKRLCRSAARRNWLKRVVRESFRREMSPDRPVDCVVRLRRVPAASQAADARSELSRHWLKLMA